MANLDGAAFTRSLYIGRDRTAEVLKRREAAERELMARREAKIREQDERMARAKNQKEDELRQRIKQRHQRELEKQKAVLDRRCAQLEKLNAKKEEILYRNHQKTSRTAVNQLNKPVYAFGSSTPRYTVFNHNSEQQKTTRSVCTFRGSRTTLTQDVQQKPFMRPSKVTKPPTPATSIISTREVRGSYINSVNLKDERDSSLSNGKVDTIKTKSSITKPPVPETGIISACEVQENHAIPIESISPDNKESDSLPSKDEINVIETKNSATEPVGIILTREQENLQQNHAIPIESISPDTKEADSSPFNGEINAIETKNSVTKPPTPTASIILTHEQEDLQKNHEISIESIPLHNRKADSSLSNGKIDTTETKSSIAKPPIPATGIILTREQEELRENRRRKLNEILERTRAGGTPSVPISNGV